MGLFIIGSICGAVIFYHLYNLLNYLLFSYEVYTNKRRRLAKEHRIKMLEERNKQLYYFQLRMIYMFGDDIVTFMPDYKEILYSDKPLEAKNWVDVDKLVNLN